MKLSVAYVASRFPEVSQTWMLREMDAVGSDPAIECELLSLFPPMKRTATVHPAAERWMPRFRRPGKRAAIAATAWWLLRAPLRLLGSVAMIAAAYSRSPGALVRALATVPIAAAHARSLRAMGVDRLHAHTATYPLLAAWLCGRLTGLPFSFTPHAHDLFVDQSFLRRRMAAADFAIAISEYHRGFLAGYGGDRTTPVHLVRCGIDLSAYEFRPRAPQPTGPVRALCVATLKDYKGHRFLFEAMAGGELERLQLDLAGDGPLRAELEELVERLGIAERVRFHGAVPEPEVTALLATTEIFVLPSTVAPNGTTEGLPTVVMEALAAGAPVVTTRVAAVPELVVDGETGLLAEPGDSDDLRRAIEALLSDPQAALRRAEAGRELVQRNHDVRASGATLARLFLTGNPHDAERATS